MQEVDHVRRNMEKRDEIFKGPTLFSSEQPIAVKATGMKGRSRSKSPKKDPETK